MGTKFFRPKPMCVESQDAKEDVFLFSQFYRAGEMMNWRDEMVAGEGVRMRKGEISFIISFFPVRVVCLDDSGNLEKGKKN